MNILRGTILLLAAGSSLFAENAPLHAIVSNGMKAVVLELQPKIEKATGHPLTFEFGTTTGLQKKIESGAPFDMAILTTDAIHDLIKKSQLTPQFADLSRTGIGLAVKTGAPRPDIHNSDSLKKTLLAAKSITYAGNGASAPHLVEMFDHLGIAREIKPKLILTEGSGAAMQSVADGKVEIVMTLISELKTVPGIHIVGPLPAELQNYVSFTASVSAHAADAEAARKMIALLKSPDARSVYDAKGMEPAPGKK